MAVPLVSAGHFVQVEPQAFASSSAAQVVSHLCRPAAQVNPQAPPVQVTLAEPTGDGHAVHEAPQELGLVSEAQTPLQLWVLAGH
jgi:hypothetical protein